MLHLDEIVNESDDAEHQSEEQDEQAPPPASGQVAPADGKHRDGNANDKNQPAHGGGALLGHVPGGTVLPDGLAGFQPPQPGNQHLAQKKAGQERHREA